MAPSVGRKSITETRMRSRSDFQTDNCLSSSVTIRRPLVRGVATITVLYSVACRLLFERLPYCTCIYRPSLTYEGAHMELGWGLTSIQVSSASVLVWLSLSVVRGF